MNKEQLRQMILEELDEARSSKKGKLQSQIKALLKKKNKTDKDEEEIHRLTGELLDIIQQEEMSEGVLEEDRAFNLMRKVLGRKAIVKDEEGYWFTGVMSRKDVERAAKKVNTRAAGLTVMPAKSQFNKSWGLRIVRAGVVEAKYKARHKKPKTTQISDFEETPWAKLRPGERVKLRTPYREEGVTWKYGKLTGKKKGTGRKTVYELVLGKALEQIIWLPERDFTPAP